MTLHIYCHDAVHWGTTYRASQKFAANFDGWRCQIYEGGYLANPGQGLVWVEFFGAHDLEFCGRENFLPVPLAALKPMKVQNDGVEKFNQAEAARQKIWNDNRSVEPKFNIDLQSLKGFAGIVIEDPKAPTRLSWTCDGSAVRPVDLNGFYIPLGDPAPQDLHRWADNIYTNQGNLDVELINSLLEKTAPGWKVDEDLAHASCEALVWIRCQQDVVVLQDESDRDELAWKTSHWLKSPFAGETSSSQTELVGKLGVLVWGNSD